MTLISLNKALDLKIFSPSEPLGIFIIFLGPFSLFGDQTLITAVRIFTIIIYFISINLLINLYLNKNLRWFYCLIFYTIPGVLYFNSVPKPDPFVIFFISIALHYLNEKKYNKSIIFFGILMTAILGPNGFNIFINS